jgi:sec-independent protein translocase protein TatA
LQLNFAALLFGAAGVGFGQVQETFMNTMFAAWLGGMEWIIVLLAVLLLFGAKKIPELAKGIGQGIREFKKATKEVTDEIQNAPTETPPAKPTVVSSTPPDSTVSQNSNPPKA